MALDSRRRAVSALMLSSPLMVASLAGCGGTPRISPAARDLPSLRNLFLTTAYYFDGTFIATSPDAKMVSSIDARIPRGAMREVLLREIRERPLAGVRIVHSPEIEQVLTGDAPVAERRARGVELLRPQGIEATLFIRGSGEVFGAAGGMRLTQNMSARIVRIHDGEVLYQRFESSMLPSEFSREFRSNRISTDEVVAQVTSTTSRHWNNWIRGDLLRFG